MGTTIRYNGRDYDSPDDLPPEVRDLYANAEKVMAGLGGVPEATGRLAPIIVNGQAYDSVDAMPPDVRSLFERVMAAPQATKQEIEVTSIDTSGIFGLSWGAGKAAAALGIRHSAGNPMGGVPGIPRPQADGSQRGRLVIACLLAAAMSAAGWWIGLFGR